MELENLASQLRTIADNLDRCAAGGGDMTSMVNINDGISEDRHWVTGESLAAAIRGLEDDRLRELVSGNHPLTVYVDVDNKEGVE